MNQLSLPVNYFIIFNDGGKKEITAQQANEIFKISGMGKKYFQLGAEFLNFSAIARIVIQEEYYREKPEERPEVISSAKDFTFAQTLQSFTPKRCIRALRSMIKGLKSYIESDANQHTGNPEKLLMRMEARLRLVEAGKDTNEFKWSEGIMDYQMITKKRCDCG